MDKRIFPVLILLILSTLFFAKLSQPKVYLDIDPTVGRKIPIAIPFFKILQGVSDSYKYQELIPRILSNDLELSGYFKVIDPLSFLEDPRVVGITLDRINFKSWATVGSEFLITGGFTYDAKDLFLELRLFDVAQGKFMMGKRYRGEIRDMRKMVHRFADEVVYKITGKVGIFCTKIVYVGSRSGNKEIFAMDFDGHNIKQLTNNKSISLSPTWSPDGKKIAYTSYMEGNPDLFIMDLKRKKSLKISYRKGLNISPAWSPDNFYLALTLSVNTYPEICIIDTNGKMKKRLTNSWSNDVSPCWSPCGKKIAFVSNRSGSPQIYTMDADGNNIKRITFEGNYNASPSWSPTGDKIAFSSLENGNFDIFTIRPDGTDLRRLTGFSGNNESPSWAPDGYHIVFSSNRDGKYHLYIMLANGTKQVKITKGEENELSPAWSPTL
ncbi:MAG: Tol-Pal system beta propeller repeat protein TolB [Thermodesulfobacteriota bacterium]|nr:Tol-Pal system beta propeller repeat protein TolB [Thermodesulfobacteriota bacterium]